MFLHSLNCFRAPQIWEEAWEYYQRSRKTRFPKVPAQNATTQQSSTTSTWRVCEQQALANQKRHICISSRVSSSLLKKASATSHCNYTSFLRTLPSGLCNSQVCSRLRLYRIPLSEEGDELGAFALHFPGVPPSRGCLNHSGWPSEPLASWALPSGCWERKQRISLLQERAKPVLFSSPQEANASGSGKNPEDSPTASHALKPAWQLPWPAWVSPAYMGWNFLSHH